MAYGAYTGIGAAEGTPTYKLSFIDLGRASSGGFVPQVQEVTHEITAMGDGLTAVTTAGTRVRLNGSSLLVRRVIITAHASNADIVVVGGSTVVAAAGVSGAWTRRGTPLNPGDSQEFVFDDLTDVWLDAVVSGDGVSYTYWT